MNAVNRLGEEQWKIEMTYSSITPEIFAFIPWQDHHFRISINVIQMQIIIYLLYSLHIFHSPSIGSILYLSQKIFKS